MEAAIGANHLNCDSGRSIFNFYFRPAGQMGSVTARTAGPRKHEDGILVRRSDDWASVFLEAGPPRIDDFFKAHRIPQMKLDPESS